MPGCNSSGRASLIRVRVGALAVAIVLLSAVTALAADMLRVTVRAANVRTEPSTTAPIVASAVQDSRLVVVGRSGQWVRVEVLDRNGTKVVGYILGTLGIIEHVIDPPQTAATQSRPLPPTTQLPAAPAAAPTRAVADEPTLNPGRTSTSTRTPNISQLPTNSAFQPALDRKAAWLADVEGTKKKRDRALLIGAAGGGGGVLVAMLAARQGSGSGATFGGLMSAGSIGYAAWTYYRAKDHLEDLDREGRTKAYVSIAPSPGGIQVAAVFAF